MREIDALVPEWEGLVRASGEALPFYTAQWIRSWWATVREETAAVRDQLAFRVLRSSAGDLVGVAPMMLTSRPATGPLRARCLQFIGADPNWTELRGLLCHPSMEGACMASLLADLDAHASEWDWIVWSGVRAGGDGERILRDVACLDAEIPSYVLDLPSTWDEMKAGLGRNVRESLRKCYNSLKREGRTFAFEAITDRKAMEPALRDFFRLHTARAALTDSVQHPDHFEDERGRAFLVDVAQRLAEEGQARVFRLTIDGALAATRVGFSVNGGLYFYYSGFDPEYARYSAPTTLVAEAFKYAIETGHHSVNLGTGTDVSKTRWHPRQVLHRGGIQLSPHLRGRVVHKAAVLASGALRSPAVWRYASKIVGRRGASLGH